MQCKSCIQKDTFRRFVWPHLVKFGCLEVGEKSYGFPNKKNRLSSHPFCPHWADRAQNFLSLVTLLHIDCCAYVPFLRFVWKDWFFGPQSDYYSGRDDDNDCGGDDDDGGRDDGGRDDDNDGGDGDDDDGGGDGDDDDGGGGDDDDGGDGGRDDDDDCGGDGDDDGGGDDGGDDGGDSGV